MIVVNAYVRSATFNPLTDWTTDPVHGVWASDPLWTPPADGGAVASWRNGGTVAGVNLTQATGSKQPTYRASTAALNNKPTVQGDGTDDRLAATFGASVSQPYYVVWIGSKSKAANVAEALWDAAPAPATGYAVYTHTGASTWRMYVTAGISGGTADTSPHLVVGTVNGVSSAISVDGTSVASGSTGATAVAEGVTLFGDRSGTDYHSGGHIAYWALFTTDPTAQAEWSTFKAWVTSFYGITVA